MPGLWHLRQKENTGLLRAEGLVEEAAVLKEFKDGSVEVLLQPRTLVQGWVNSCAAFTKIARQLARRWRSNGFRLANIIDGFLFSVSGTFKEACVVRDQVLGDIKRLGFYVSWAKSVLMPSTICKFMGVLVDSASMRFHMPGGEIEKLKCEFLEKEQTRQRCQIRRRRKTCGYCTVCI